MNLCASGCGFFGSPEMSGMCSKCFKVHQKKQQVTPQTADAKTGSVPSLEVAEPPKPTTSSSATEPEEANRVEEDAVTPQPAERVQKNRKRCFECNKKVGLTGIACRCTFVFCSMHRYPDQHNCTLDYKALDRSVLAARNQTVVASKIDKL